MLKKRQMKNFHGSKTKRIIDSMNKTETEKIMTLESFNDYKLASKC